MKIIHSTTPVYVFPILREGIHPGTDTGHVSYCDPILGPSPYVYLAVFEEQPDSTPWGNCHIGVSEQYVRENPGKFRNYSDRMDDYFIKFVDELGITRLEEEAVFEGDKPSGNQIVTRSAIPPEALESLTCEFKEINDIARMINPNLKIIGGK
jgi:hypothetical protein